MQKLFLSICFIFFYSAAHAKSCQRELLLEDVHRTAAQKVKSLNESFRPMVQAFDRYVRALPDFSIDELDAQVTPLIFGPVPNLAVKLHRKHAPPYAKKSGYQPFRYKVGIEDIPAHLRPRLATDQKKMSRLFYLFGNLFEFDRAEKGLRTSATVIRAYPFLVDFPVAVFSMLVAPISEYGYEFNLKLARAASILIHIIMSPEFAQTALENDRTAQSPSFARNYDAGKKKRKQSPQQAALLEGVSSIYQAIALLASHEVRGFGSGDDLVRELVRNENGENSFLANFARFLPMGYLGPIVIRGQTFPQAIRLDKEKGLVMDDNVRDFFMRGQNDQICRLNEDARTLKQLTTLGCPLARKSPDDNNVTSLQLAVELFRDVYEKLR
jgi:hypothetical protein